jgi:hypothetical protein
MSCILTRTSDALFSSDASGLSAGGDTLQNGGAPRDPLAPPRQLHVAAGFYQKLSSSRSLTILSLAFAIFLIVLSGIGLL